MLNLKQNYFFIKVITFALLIYVVYTQSIASELNFNTGLLFFLNSVAPIKPSRLSNEKKLQFTFPKELTEIIIGLILGDLNVHKDKRAINGNACFRFLQSTIHTDYLEHLYTKFQDYCSVAPKILTPRPDKRTGKIYPTMRFKTYALPCCNEFFNLFYPEGKKIVPLNIGDFLTPLGLAYWICEDGTFEKSSQRVILCTESFAIVEVEALILVLNSKWDLNSYKSKRGTSYRIAIPRKSLPIMQNLCKPHMPIMMMHKIGL